ncbi:DNA-directed RNA polymerase I, subunit RPA34.5 [Cunninghamella echinulata]|nr:DNA-directed RNA polymerase I, subunit RPA34.5 [Cunninghamella echinulata]
MTLNMEAAIPEEFTQFDPRKQQATVYDIENIENDDDKEIWLIRVPQQVEKKSLDSLSFKYPKTAGKPLSKLLINEKDTFTLYKVPEGKDLEADVGISGQEMLGFNCLLPSKNKQGKLVFAPKKISNYLILDEEVAIPDGTLLSESIRDTPITKREHPEGLKMRYKPYGYYTGQQNTKDEEMDVQMKNDDEHDDDNKKEIKSDAIDDETLKRKRTVGDDDDDNSNDQQEKKKKKKKEKKDKKDKKDKKSKKENA